jgi:hypothetical protein
LRIYSQELFLVFLSTDADPFEHADRDILLKFATGHPAIEHLLAQSQFDWPTTFVWGQARNPLDADMPELGFLRFLGYRVGKKGLPIAERRDTLCRAINARVPAVFAKQYSDAWQYPNTCGRLQKMAETIASFCRNAKRNPIHLDLAITHWEEDLAWLKREFYEDLCWFRWPDSGF